MAPYPLSEGNITGAQSEEQLSSANKAMKSPHPYWILSAWLLWVTHPALATEAISPLDISFTRQAVQRLIFDPDQAIPLSMLRPETSITLAVEHPTIPVSGGDTVYQMDRGSLTASAEEPSESALWIGGFNPFATYDVHFEGWTGDALEAGVELATPTNEHRVILLARFHDNRCTSLRWQVFVGGEEQINETIPLETPVSKPFVFRVQMLGSGLNVFVEQHGVNQLVLTRDYTEMIDLRRKEHIRSFEFRLLTRLSERQSVTVRQASGALTTGVGQADIRAITYEDGSTFMDQGRLWFTMSVRGRRLPHPMQGIFSLNPSVFDLRFEGIVVFDRGDGLLRNDMASHLFYDRNAKEWRGLTVGFSVYGDPGSRERKVIWSAQSPRDPRFGFSIMHSGPVSMPLRGEDPHIIYDNEVGKWRVLACSKGDPGWPATLYESDRWNGPYELIAGPATVNGTGCQLQKFGGKWYALFGSSDRKFYVYSYPELEPLGALDMHRPPWDDTANTRCWPNVIPLPEGYPAPYIALSMDRSNFPNMGKSWTYGSLYLYHGYTKEN